MTKQDFSDALNESAEFGELFPDADYTYILSHVAFVTNLPFIHENSVLGQAVIAAHRGGTSRIDSIKHFYNL